eukprot:7748-Rhodomonas_salina.1
MIATTGPGYSVPVATPWIASAVVSQSICNSTASWRHTRESLLSPLPSLSVSACKAAQALPQEHQRYSFRPLLRPRTSALPAEQQECGCGRGRTLSRTPQQRA